MSVADDDDVGKIADIHVDDDDVMEAYVKYVYMGDKMDTTIKKNDYLFIIKREATENVTLNLEELEAAVAVIKEHKMMRILEND